ncbi:MAG: SufD family Fe-S cluster assembly protein [Lachnospiraceae bacterium]|nr:SufD family Fe-S cluster assembly protein [Lachnospiraceae bacterium]
MEREYKVNPLPVLTWNRLDLNVAKMKTDAAFSAEDFCREVTLPEGMSVRTLPDAAALEEWVAAHGGKPAQEEVIACKYPMVAGQSFPTGMGEEADRLFDEADAPVKLYELKEGCRPEAPVRLDYLYPDAAASAGRILIHLGKYSELTLIQYFKAEKEAANIVAGTSTCVYLEEGAKLHLVKLQMLPKQSVFLDDSGARLERDAQLEVTQLELGAGTVYLGALYDHWGDRSSLNSRLGYICAKDGFIDHNHVDTYRGKKNEGVMRFHGVLLENAHKVSRETLDFRRGCTGSEGDEEENMLVLGEDAIDRANPMILGEEEDMNGRHAVTIGKLSPDMLFYMQSRGINALTAQQLMVRASVNRVSQHIPDRELQEAADRYVDRIFCEREDCDAPCAD